MANVTNNYVTSMPSDAILNYSNFDCKISNYLGIPITCPYCGAPTEIRRDQGTAVLYCGGKDCPAMLINRLDHFCSKDKGLDIRGLSKATLEKLIDWGWVSSIFDILNRRVFHVQRIFT